MTEKHEETEMVRNLPSYVSDRFIFVSKEGDEFRIKSAPSLDTTEEIKAELPEEIISAPIFSDIFSGMQLKQNSSGRITCYFSMLGDTDTFRELRAFEDIVLSKDLGIAPLLQKEEPAGDDVFDSYYNTYTLVKSNILPVGGLENRVSYLCSYIPRTLELFKQRNFDMQELNFNQITNTSNPKIEEKEELSSVGSKETKTARFLKNILPFVDIAEGLDLIGALSLGYLSKSMRDILFIGHELIDKKFSNLAKAKQNIETLIVDDGERNNTLLDWLERRYNIINNTARSLLDIIPNEGDEKLYAKYSIEDIKTSEIDAGFSLYYFKNPKELVGFFKRAFNPDSSVITSDINDIKTEIIGLLESGSISNDYKEKLQELAKSIGAEVTNLKAKKSKKAVVEDKSQYFEDCITLNKIKNLSAGVLIKALAPLWQAKRNFNRTLFGTGKVKSINEFDVAKPAGDIELDMVRTLAGQGVPPEDFALTSISKILDDIGIVQLGNSIYSALSETEELLTEMYSKISDESTESPEFFDSTFKLNSGILSSIQQGLLAKIVYDNFKSKERFNFKEVLELPEIQDFAASGNPTYAKPKIRNIIDNIIVKKKGFKLIPGSDPENPEYRLPLNQEEAAVVSLLDAVRILPDFYDEKNPMLKLDAALEELAKEPVFQGAINVMLSQNATKGIYEGPNYEWLDLQFDLGSNQKLLKAAKTAGIGAASAEAGDLIKKLEEKGVTPDEWEDTKEKATKDTIFAFLRKYNPTKDL